MIVVNYSVYNNNYMKGSSMTMWLGCGHCSSPALNTKLS